MTKFERRINKTKPYWQSYEASPLLGLSPSTPLSVGLSTTFFLYFLWSSKKPLLNHYWIESIFGQLQRSLRLLKSVCTYQKEIFQLDFRLNNKVHNGFFSQSKIGWLLFTYCAIDGFHPVSENRKISWLVNLNFLLIWQSLHRQIHNILMKSYHYLNNGFLFLRDRSGCW